MCAQFVTGRGDVPSAFARDAYGSLGVYVPYHLEASFRKHPSTPGPAARR